MGVIHLLSSPKYIGNKMKTPQHKFILSKNYMTDDTFILILLPYIRRTQGTLSCSTFPRKVLFENHSPQCRRINEKKYYKWPLCNIANQHTSNEVDNKTIP